MAATDTTPAPIFTLDRAPLAGIAAALGTPCYVYSAPVVRGRLAALRQAFDATGYDCALHYALKANSSLGIVRLVRDRNADAAAEALRHHGREVRRQVYDAIDGTRRFLGARSFAGGRRDDPGEQHDSGRTDR